VPSAKLISEMFGRFSNWNHWNNPFKNAELVFENNPYVDEFIDDVNDEVFHDHYRIYDLNNIEIPLIIQMLKFWQFTDEETQDYLPELYFSPEEIKLGEKIIETYTNGEFGTLLLTNTVKEYYSDDINNLLLKETQQYKNLTFFYYGSKDIKDTVFTNIKCVNFKDINITIRIQLYIKTKALVNIGYQSGVNDSVCRYSKVICTPSTGVLGADYLGAIKYLKNTWNY
jgi:hypothetical protein